MKNTHATLTFALAACFALAGCLIPALASARGRGDHAEAHEPSSHKKPKRKKKPAARSHARRRPHVKTRPTHRHQARSHARRRPHVKTRPTRRRQARSHARRRPPARSRPAPRRNARPHHRRRPSGHVTHRHARPTGASLAHHRRPRHARRHRTVFISTPRRHLHRHHRPGPFIRWRYWRHRRTIIYVQPAPIITSTRTSTRTVVIDAPTVEPAWRALADGQAGTAVQLFNAAVRRDPNDPEAHVGLALALASLGDHDEAADAMRRAVELDVELVSALALDPIFDDRLADLADLYAERSDADVWNTDYPFMLASVRLLLGDLDGAEQAVAAATVRGERTTALDDLRRQLEDIARQ